MSDWSEAEIGEAISVAAASGVAVRTWTVLSRSNRLVLKLGPGGLIAKAVRISDSTLLVNELAVARHVAAQAGPAAPPATGASVLFGKRVAVSLWQPIETLAPPADAEVCRAYTDLRRCLDSYSGALPDFREAVVRAADLLHTRKFPGLSNGDAALLRAFYAASFSRLPEFRWTGRALHGDPHAGNAVSTRQGLRWLDFESACTGPVEWDLSALPDCSPAFDHDPVLLAVLTRLRRACVVVWCAAKTNPHIAEVDAVAHHMEFIRAASC